MKQPVAQRMTVVQVLNLCGFQLRGPNADRPISQTIGNLFAIRIMTNTQHGDSLIHKDLRFAGCQVELQQCSGRLAK